MEQLLGVQLPTLVTLATHCLCHSHALVKLIEIGLHLTQTANVRYTKFLAFHFSLITLLLLAVDCGPLPAPTNGRVDTSNGTTFESTATYTCDTGYTLSGSQIRTCGADKSWDLSAPGCERKNENFFSISSSVYLCMYVWACTCSIKVSK